MMPAHRAVPVGGLGWAGARRNDLYCSAEAESGIFDWRVRQIVF